MWMRMMMMMMMDDESKRRKKTEDSWIMRCLRRDPARGARENDVNTEEMCVTPSIRLTPLSILYIHEYIYVLYLYTHINTLRCQK